MPKITKVGHGSRKLDCGFDWPYDIWISHDEPRFPISLGEGVGHGAAGCSISADELLDDKWADIVSICNCEWLVAEIRRLKQAGQAITAQKLEDHWRSL